ncbi:MAG: hypothetical protein F6K19_49835 [Cyanothece sp. SIO1E1]|nr:hypothetical protein [Cyanothece sp. SIO1E1]
MQSTESTNHLIVASFLLQIRGRDCRLYTLIDLFCKRQTCEIQQDWHSITLIVRQKDMLQLLESEPHKRTLQSAAAVLDLNVRTCLKLEEQSTG